MTNTLNSKKVWEEVKAKIRAERLKKVYAYMYNDEFGNIGTTRKARADRERQLKGIDERELEAETRINAEKYLREYPQGFVELMYTGIKSRTPNVCFGPPIEPSFSHIEYPMDVFESLQEKLNGRRSNIDLAASSNHYTLRTLGVFTREILRYFPIDETLDALKNVKKRLGKDSGRFGKSEKQGLKLLERYLNHEVLLPVWVAENHGLSQDDFIRTKEETQCDLRDLRDCLYNGGSSPRSSKSVRLVLDKNLYQIRTYSGKHTLNDIANNGRIVI